MASYTYDKAELVSRLMAAKEATGKTFDQIAAELGMKIVLFPNLPHMFTFCRLYAVSTHPLHGRFNLTLSFDFQFHHSLYVHCISIGLTNLYTSQLFMNQCQLKPATAEKLKTVVPGISADDLKIMQVKQHEPLHQPLYFLGTRLL